MTKRFRSILIAIVVLGVLGAGLVAALHVLRPGVARADEADEKKPTSQPTTEEEHKVVATVKTVPLRVGEISQTITAYGTVSAQPGEVAVYSVPFEARVRHVRVAGGQQVEKSAALVEIEPSPDAKLQLIEAQNALEAAKKDFAQTRQRFDMKLATNQELSAAQQAMQSAQVKLDALTQRGAAEEKHVVAAEGDGLVSKVDVQEGQIVPAGGSLVELVARDRIEVRLGVEPSDVMRVHAGQPVQIFAVTGDTDHAIAGKVRLITQRINPDTRLTDVFAAPESADGLLLDAFVRGELVAETKKDTLIVPRQAVLPDDEGYVMYTVKDGHAVKHVVKMGLQNDKEVEVISEGLEKGEPVVDEGNYELEDGMAVTTESAP
jgi:membrane fusion protein (multidrug efflux system)